MNSFSSFSSPYIKLGKSSVILGLFILIACFLVVFDIYNGETGLTTDGAYFLQISRNFFQGEGYTLAMQKHTVFPPGYPLLIGVFAFFIRHYLMSAQIVSFVAFLCAILVLYHILKRNTRDDILIVLAMAIFIFNRTVLNLSNQVMSEPLFILLVIVNILLMFKVLKNHNYTYKNLILIGLVNGFMYLTRPEGLIFFVVNFTVMAILISKYHLKIFKLLVMCFVFVLLSFPYIHFLHSATGKWMLSGKTMNLVQLEVVENQKDELLWEKKGYQLLEDGRNVMVDAAATSRFKPIAYVWQNRANLFKRAILNSITYLKIICATFGLWTIFLVFAFKSKINFMKLYLILLTFSSLYLLLFKPGRYWICFLPVFLVLLVVITESLVASQSVNKWIVVFFVLTGISLNFYTGRDTYMDIFRKKEEHIVEKMAGEWIKCWLPVREIIVVRKPFVPYFADHEWLRIPWFTESSDFIGYMKRNSLSYFIVSKHERSTRPFIKLDEETGKMAEYAEIRKEFNHKEVNLKLMQMR